MLPDLDSLTKEELVARLYEATEKLDAFENVDRSFFLRTKYDLTATQATLFMALEDLRPRTTEALCTTLWSADVLPESNVLRVHLTKLRAKLRPHGFLIRNVYGLGYQMEKAS